jgi:hypothetical protein
MVRVFLVVPDETPGKGPTEAVRRAVAEVHNSDGTQLYGRRPSRTDGERSTQAVAGDR